jgi:hypothetical protein
MHVGEVVVVVVVAVVFPAVVGCGVEWQCYSRRKERGILLRLQF